MKIKNEIFLLIMCIALSFNCQCQSEPLTEAETAELYKAMNLLHKRGVVNLEETKTVTERINLKKTIKEKQVIASEANPELYKKLVDAIQQYKEEVVRPQIELSHPVIADGQPMPEQLSIPPIFETLLEGLIPWILDSLVTKDIPKPLAIFKWMNIAKDQYRNDIDFRAMVNKEFGIAN